MPTIQQVTDNTTDVLQLYRDDSGGLYVDIQFTTAASGPNIFPVSTVKVVRIPVQNVIS